MYEHSTKNEGLDWFFFLFAHEHSTKMYGPREYIVPLCTIIWWKIRVLINLFLLFVHDHSTKIRGHSYSLIYSFLNCANISYTIFKVLLPLYSCRYYHCVKCVQIKSTKHLFSPNAGKYGLEKTPYLGTFHAVYPSISWLYEVLALRKNAM